MEGGLDRSSGWLHDVAIGCRPGRGPFRGSVLSCPAHHRCSPIRHLEDRHLGRAAPGHSCHRQPRPSSACPGRTTSYRHVLEDRVDLLRSNHPLRRLRRGVHPLRRRPGVLCAEGVRLGSQALHQLPRQPAGLARRRRGGPPRHRWTARLRARRAASASTSRCSARRAAIRPRSRSSRGWTGRSTARTASGPTRPADPSPTTIEPHPTGSGPDRVARMTRWPVGPARPPVSDRRPVRPSPTSRPGAGRLDSLPFISGRAAGGSNPGGIPGPAVTRRDPDTQHRGLGGGSGPGGGRAGRVEVRSTASLVGVGYRLVSAG